MTAASPIEATTAPTTGRSPSRLVRFGAVTLDPRRNGLNLLRLVLAYMVLVAHGWYIGGDGVGWEPGGQNIGGWAVIGFFAISGYLITGSRLTKPLGDFLLHRVTRIFPAFVVNIVVTAAVFAPIGYWYAHRTLEGFLTTGTTPLNYVVVNLGLKVYAYDVAGTPAAVPYVGAWNGSLWTLYYEFLCYLVIALLMSVAWFRRSTLALAATLVFSIFAYAGQARLAGYTQSNADLVFLFKLLPFFLAGALIYRLRDKVVLTWPGALLAVAASVAIVAVLPGWGAQLASPLIAYAILWLGAVVPCPEYIRRNDISYGVYIYAFPVQQLLAMAGAHAWPLWLFDVVAIAATVPFAAASWYLVERPLMRRARRVTSHGTPPRAAATAPTDVTHPDAAPEGDVKQGRRDAPSEQDGAEVVTSARVTPSP